jgi:Lecithin:cholesterol acyltransferase/WD40-like Beta Propeller Repeat
MGAAESLGVLLGASTMARRTGRARMALMNRVLTSVLLATVVALALAGPASATFSGSNGKVAYVGHDRQLWIDDPWDEGPAKSFGRVETENPHHLPAAAAHGPSWSPDGTMLAYTAPVPDSFGREHSAVFVRDASGENPRQVTEPFATAPDSCPTCDDGHTAWDQQPTWTPEGKIAFIRFVASGDQSPRVAERGTTIYTVDPAGGALSRFVHVPLDENNRHVIESFVWPTASSQPFLLLATRGGFEIRRGSHTGPLVASALGITDLDASPDGQRLAFSTIVDGYKVHVVELDGTPVESFATPVTERPQIRFSPDGNSIIRHGCAGDRDGQQHCGLKTHRLQDPNGDIRPDDPLEVPYVDLDQPINGGHNFRSQFDVQGQDLPIVYLPGFLGSEIQCDGDNVWMPTLPPLTMQPIMLSADGLTNQTCANAGPTGKPVDKFFFKVDVYGHAEEWLTKMNPPGGKRVLGWDWRKRPQESIKVLDDTVNELIADNELGQAQGAERVSLVGHSYGGLLMRLYVDDPDRAKKVARMLTVGSPFWGSTKPFFPLTFGIEAPGFAALDLMIGNEDIKDAMRNFGGAYHLLADDNFGQWLRVDGQDLGQDGVRQFLESVGAQGHLINEGWTTHRERLDGWFDNEGRIDVRAVVGVGLLTPRHVIVQRDPAEGDADVGIRFADGDETVPAHSAWQGEPGGAALGDPIHLQRRCGITHMAQTRDVVVQGAYAQFLLFGRTPRKLPTPDCEPRGKLIQVTHDVPIPPPVGAPEDFTGSSAAAGPMTLGDAALADLADIYRLPGGTQIVTNQSRPVELAFHAEGWSMTVTDLKGDARGASRRYGPLTGDVVLAAGGAAVTVDGEPVDGVPVDQPGDSGGDQSGGAGDQSGGGGPTPAAQPAAGTTADAAQPAAGTTAGAAPAPRATARLGRTAKVSAKGVATVGVTTTGPGKGVLALKAKARGKRVRLGAARFVAQRPGTLPVRVRLTAAGRAALRRGPVAASASLRFGDVQTSARLTLRR